MTPIPGKRYGEGSVRSSRKRQRVGYAPIALGKKSQSTFVALDSLPWKQAPLNSQLEDAEGFFGLEEIDDIEVVKNSQSGKVEFRVGKVSSESFSPKIIC